MASLFKPRNLFFFFSGIALAACLLFIPLFGCGDIENGTVASLTVSPGTTTIGINSTKNFSAIGKDSNGKIVSTTVTWAVAGAIGSIASSGLFSAGAAEGTGSVIATSGSISAEAQVTITFKGWIEGRVSASDGSYPSGLKVYLLQLPTTCLDFTGSDGKYSIADVPAGSYEVRTIETPTYYVGSEEVTVGRGETAPKDIYVIIKPGVPTIPPVTVPTFI